MSSKPLYEPVGVTPARLAAGRAAAMQGKPFAEVQEAYTGIRRVIKSNETPASKLYRLAAANAREFAREFPTAAMEIVRQEILDKR